MPVAQLAPLNGVEEVDWDARMESLERGGLIRLPKRKPDMKAFLDAHSPVEFEGSVLEDLLEERRTSDR